jgi:hypothetical protein
VSPFGRAVLAPDLAALEQAAQRAGWATGAGDIEAVRSAALLLGWRAVPSRHGEPALDVLRPTTSEDAKPRSLSAQYGLGEQPLHTDGAHNQYSPPDIVVLAADQPSKTPTRLWRSGKAFLPGALPEFASHGVFLVDGGKHSFFATARERGRIRFDPGCMTPCDLRARQTVDFISQGHDQVVEHHWSSAGQVLVIDNRQTLHGRAALVEGDENRELHRMAFQLPEAK